MTVSPREQLPTLRGRQTQAAIDAAARAVIARKGILAATISDIAAEAGKSTASFYNYYDSKEAMVREWAVRFRDEARERSRAAAEPGLTNWERSYQAAAAHWNTYRNRLAEIISVSQLAMISDDFAEYWADICSLPIGLITQMVKQAQRHGFCAREDDPHLLAVAMVSMLNQFCYARLTGDAAADAVDDDACIATLANVFYRTIYHKEYTADYEQTTGGSRGTRRHPRVRRDGLADGATGRVGRTSVPGALPPRRGAQAEGRDDRHALSDRFLRTLSRRLHGHPRDRFPRVEHPLPRL